MMLLALLATALSVSPALPTDSVRNAAKAAARPDTTLTTPAKQVPPPTIAPIVPAGTVGVAGSNAPSSAGSQATAQAGTAAPSSAATTSSSWTTTLVKSSTVVTATNAAPTPNVDAPPAAAPADATSARTVVATANVGTATSVPEPSAAARPQHEVVQQAITPMRAPAEAGPALATNASSVVSASAAPHAEPTTAPAPKAAAADASAVAAPHAAVTSTRVDARTVVSVRSSERIEPLYSVPLPSSRIRFGAPSIADSIVVYKRERTLTLFYRGVPVKSYFVALGSKPVGDKERAGDQRTPEGVFHVNAHNPASKFHLALRISYPDDAHRARSAALGADPGGDIMIHGLPPEYSEAGKDQVANDWTNGCVALSNQEIEELWRAVPDGTPVQIKP